MHFRQIFEFTDRIIFKGKVLSGIGEGRYYTEQSGYVEQFKEKLGFVPFPGTLNIEIELIERNKLRMLKDSNAININDFKNKNRTFGAVRCFRAKINGIDGAIVLPLRTHYSNVLELISEFHLRKKLNLKDGDCVEIIIYFDRLEY
jgi:riboflavin kinase